VEKMKVSIKQLQMSSLALVILSIIAISLDSTDVYVLKEEAGWLGLVGAIGFCIALFLIGFAGGIRAGVKNHGHT
jgi:hypothetical protein